LSYTFKHHITQEVTYENLLGDQQRQLHHAVGDTLERLRPEAVEPLAYHYSRSGLRDKTLFYLDKAARKTQREYANETALNYYSQALALEERWEWRRGQAEILHILGQREEERASLEILEASLSGGGEEAKRRRGGAAGGRRGGGEAKRRGGGTSARVFISSSGQEGAKGRRRKKEKSPRLLASLRAEPQDEASPPLSPAAFELAYLWGQYYETIGNYTEAQAAVEKALAASRELDDLAAEVRCLAQLGLIAYRQGNYDHAKTWYNHALTLFRPEEIYLDEVTQAFIQAFNGLGAIHYEQGEFDQAQACYKRALALSRLSSDRPGEANTFFGLGVTAFYQRHFSEAQNYYQRTLTIQRAIGDRAGEGTTLYSLAQVFSDAGDYGQAEQYLSAALTILQATSNRWYEINVWNSLGILYQELGHLSKAQDCLERALWLAKEIGAEDRQAYPLINLGLVMRDQGNLVIAERLLTEGLALVQALDNKRLESAFLSYLSTINLQLGRLPRAVDQASAALTLRQALDLRLYITDDLATLAATHLAAGQVAEALIYAEQTLAFLAECGGEGPEFPQRDYFIGYQVLTAAGQAERAKAILQAAYQLVLARAEKITDPDLRQSFLEQVAVNREIVAEYARILGAAQL
jgi:tetratricopeptide (TPR) repeat protein